MDLRDNKFPPSDESSLIAALRFPLAIGIVLLHNPFPGNFGQYFSYQSIFTGIVSLFFAISGYLYFGTTKNWKWGGYWTMLKKKFFALFIPYLAWNLLKIGLLALQHALHLYHNPDVVPVYKWGVMEWLEGFGVFSGIPRIAPLWYLQDLMLVFLLSPILYWLIKHISLYLIPFIFMMFFVPPLEYGRWVRLLHSISVFTAGGLIAWHLPQFAQYIKKSWFPLVFCLGIGLLGITPYCNDYYMGLTILFSMLTWLVCGKILLIHRPSLCKSHWAMSSFFLYCSHGVIGAYLPLRILASRLSISPWISCFVTIILIILLSEAGCRLAEKWSWSRLLFLGKRH